MIRDNQLDCALRASVWVCRANWAYFGNGDHVGNSSSIAIDGRRRGEDDIRDIMLGHAAEESDGSANIDAVVFEGDLGRFTDCLESTTQYLLVQSFVPELPSRLRNG